MRGPTPTPRAEARAALPRAALQLSLQHADARHRTLLPRHRVARWLRAALQRPSRITVRIVGEDDGRELNRKFRGQDHATNVLTFDYAREPEVVADLVLCAPVVAAEATAQRLDLEAHYAHLVVHGALHAQGFGHDRDDDAGVMESREAAILIELGFQDPYTHRSS